MVLLAMASAKSLAVDLPDCSVANERWVCWEGSVQLAVAEVASAEVDDRFSQLTEWPMGSFRPVWWEGTRGWQTTVTDGERSQVSRWFVLGSRAVLLTASGPSEGLEASALRLFDSVRLLQPR